jgi:2-amino-4-hydroxy-6-hydroxymethyldihydropteridine diphosphokinase
MSVRAYIALGSNLFDRAGALAAARAAIGALPDTRLVGESAVEETPPFGVVDQPPYLNQMLAVETALAPAALLDALQEIERSAGRRREAEVRWGPRIIDCDIVLYGDVTSDAERLSLPHPGLSTRAFWQRELAELGVEVHAAGRVGAPR